MEDTSKLLTLSLGPFLKALVPTLETLPAILIQCLIIRKEQIKVL